MPVEICTVGGYNEVGKNCTAVKVDDEVVIFDMGVHMEPYIKLTEEDEDIIQISTEQMIKAGAIPDISAIKDWIKKTIAIIPTHAHLDHIGAIPYIAHKFDAPIIATPYTIEVIKKITKDEKINLPNKLKVLHPNDTLKLSPNIKLEFIHMTHSTPQTVMAAIHTKYGIIIYANDFKFDSTPTLGRKPNFERLREFGEKYEVLALILDSTYAPLKQKTPSEAVAKEMLREVMLGTESKGKAMIVTTFSSHLARLKSIIEFGKKLNRKIVFLGRSLHKYVKAGEDIGIINFSKEVEITKYGREAKRKLKEIMKKGPEKYLLVVTGHQGEPKSVLSKMASKILPFNFDSEDEVIFSCKVIPTKINEANREKMEQELKKYGVRIFRDVHVSGHAAREDHRDLINMVKPTNIIPAHGEITMTSALADLAAEMGYTPGKTVHIMRDGQKLLL
jgi:ribonuclease J